MILEDDLNELVKSMASAFQSTEELLSRLSQVETIICQPLLLDLIPMQEP